MFRISEQTRKYFIEWQWVFSPHFRFTAFLFPHLFYCWLMTEIRADSTARVIHQEVETHHLFFVGMFCHFRRETLWWMIAGRDCFTWSLHVDAFSSLQVRVCFRANLLQESSKFWQAFEQIYQNFSNCNETYKMLSELNKPLKVAGKFLVNFNKFCIF